MALTNRRLLLKEGVCGTGKSSLIAALEQRANPYLSHWLTQTLFKTWPQLQRIEGTTRQDNWVMRRVFQACSYLKADHFRWARA